MKKLLISIVMLLTLCLNTWAGEITIEPELRTELKAVFGQVESRDMVPARARLGGTIVSLNVEEGSAVKAGDVLATIVDDKLALQLQASDANISSFEAQLQNAATELARVKKLWEAGVSTKAALETSQTQVDVLTSQSKAARAGKAVLEQQATEGKVLAPASGRVLSVPVTRGSVVMQGEAVAQLASGQFYLRLSLPERHAGQLKEGALVEVGGAVGSATATDKAASGKLVKLYPQIEGGKVAADVVVDGLGDYFVGQRVLVRIPVDQREVITVPLNALSLRSGVDYVKLAEPSNVAVPVITGEMFEGTSGKRIEILSGLSAGDKVIAP